jgi:hypothetical protein
MSIHQCNVAVFALLAASAMGISTHAFASECAELNANVSPLSDFQECSVTPVSVELDLYEVGMCTEKPDFDSKDTCGTIFLDDSGLLSQISKGSSIPLANASLPEGEYSYGYLVFGNTFGIKIELDFGTDAISDIDGEQLVQYCWTEGGMPLGEDAGEVPMACGTEIPDDLGYAYETVNFLPKPDDTVDGGVRPVTSADDIPSSQQGKFFDGRILDGFGNLADPVNLNAEKLMVIFRLDNPLNIVADPNLKLEFGFRVEDMTAVSIGPCPGSSGNCVDYGVLAGFGFDAEIQ